MNQSNQVLELLGAPGQQPASLLGMKKGDGKRILLLIALGEGLEKASQGRHGRSSQGLSLSKGSADSRDLYLEKNERDLDSKERCNMGGETIKK